MNVKIEKLVFGGQGMGRVDNKAIFVWNALPGEEVEVEIKKNKGNFAEGIARSIIKKADFRMDPKEEHYLSCSPWQILSFEDENRWKVEIAKETYKKLGNLEIEKLEIVTDGVEYGYRNKMEYSFTVAQSETDKPLPVLPLGRGRDMISLAFFEREGKKHIAIETCELARPEMNRVALKLLAWVNENKISIRSLKTIIVRSNQKGEVLAGLFLKDRMNFKNYPELDDDLIGLTVYYSTHKSPASVPTDILYKVGQDYLEEELNGAKLRYGLFSFFQINVPIFKKALLDIGNFVENTDLIDYYSGVGSIGLALHDKCKQLTLVESNPEADACAKFNIDLNRLNKDLDRKVEAICKPSELMTDLITADKTIIFDPPRAGLDKRVVEKVLAELPKKIIYLSCDLATQARDIGLLKHKYSIKFLKLYNFFPRTAHIEGLCVLEKN